MVLKVERALYIHSPHLQFLPDRDLNSQPLDYESGSLTIRPQLLMRVHDSTHACAFHKITGEPLDYFNDVLTTFLGL